RSAALFDRLLLFPQKLKLQCRDDRVRNLVLDYKDVIEVPIVALRPQVAARITGNQLCADSEAASRFPDATFQGVAHVHGPGDLLNVNDLTLEREGAVARDNLQCRDF